MRLLLSAEMSVVALAGAIILLRELDRQARQQGGAVYMLNGNHESLNVSGNFRRVLLCLTPACPQCNHASVPRALLRSHCSK